MYENNTQVIKSMLNDIENKLSKNPNRVSDIYFSSGGRNLTDSVFNFKEFDTKKFESAYKVDNNKGLLSTLGSSTYSFDKTAHENEIRKILEREIDPYLFSIKNELRLFADHFHKECGDYKVMLNEITNFKQMVTENKKLFYSFQEDFQIKLNEINEKHSAQQDMINQTKAIFEEFESKLKSNEDKLSQTPQELKSINEKLKKLENSHYNLDKRVESINHNDILIKLRNLDNKVEAVSAQVEEIENEINSGKKEQDVRSKKLIEEFDEFKIGLSDLAGKVEVDLKKFNANLLEQSGNFENKIEGVNKVFQDKINLVSQIMKNLREKTQELDDKSVKNDGYLKSLILNLKNVEKNFSEIQERNQYFEEQSKRYENTFKELELNIKNVEENFTNIQERNLRYDEQSKRYENALKGLEKNIKTVEDNYKDLKDCSSVIPNISNDIGSLHKNVESLTQNLNITVNDNQKKSQKIVEKLLHFDEENKATQNRIKDVIIAIKNLDSKYEERMIQLAKIAAAQNSSKPSEVRTETKVIDQEFKQEVVSRLVNDEKKFIEIEENLCIIDKNMKLLSQKFEILESNLAGNPQDKTSNQAECFLFNSCEVHSFRKNFILKGKDTISLTLEAKKMPKGKIFTEKEIISNTEFRSKKSNIDTKVNFTNERSSDKFKLNALYLKCDPVKFLEHAHKNLKGYLPKHYFSYNKAFVNIIEAEFDENHNEFKDMSAKHTNELFEADLKESIIMKEEEDEKTDSDLEAYMMEDKEKKLKGKSEEKKNTKSFPSDKVFELNKQMLN